MKSALEHDLEALACYSLPGPGVTRLPWTHVYEEACDWLANRMRGEGLHAARDAAGNLIGRLEGGRAEGKRAVAVGSHIDTVPHGGRYDGALGVLAGLDLARILRADRSRLRRPFWLVAFMDEEGARFGTSFFGSRAFTGEELPPLDRTDAAGMSIAGAMSAAGYPPDRLPEAFGVDELSAYLELHVEQGPRLDDGEYDIGLVTAIVGRRVLRIEAAGVANHAGTTPRAQRRDALRTIVELAAELHAVFDRREGCTFNIGKIDAGPGAVNVVPGTAAMELELRSASTHQLVEAEHTLRMRVAAAAGDARTACRCDLVDAVDPVACDAELVALLGEVAEREGAATVELVSGAGHDAMVVGRHVPAAMVLVPSRRGVSHAPDEHTDISHCMLGARVLAGAVRALVLDEGAVPA